MGGFANFTPAEDFEIVEMVKTREPRVVRGRFKTR